jgi:hypothetical protein
MKILAGIVSIMALLAVSGFAFADVATGEIGAGAQPGDQVPRICIQHRDVCIGTCANPPGINDYDYRTGLYAFTGEQISYVVVVRDPNGALDIGFVKALVGGQEEVLGNPIENPDFTTCDGMGDLHFGIEGTDKAFHVLISVEPQWYGDTKVVVAAYNSNNQVTEATHNENWFFNPAISISVTTSDGMPIHFEQLPYGADTPEERTVHSLNKIKVKNTAEGGVNMWMYVGGTDLYDPTGASKCPLTNYIGIEEDSGLAVNEHGLVPHVMQYRGWSGTQWTSWEGWNNMYKYNQNDGCGFTNKNFDGVMSCYGATPVPYGDTGADAQVSQLENVLTNQGTLEIEFKLTYPMPCVGSFSQGTIYVFGKAV